MGISIQLRGRGRGQPQRQEQEQRLSRCRASHFSLLVQRKVTKRKHTLQRARTTCGSVGVTGISGRGLLPRPETAHIHVRRPAGFIRHPHRASRDPKNQQQEQQRQHHPVPVISAEDLTEPVPAFAPAFALAFAVVVAVVVFAPVFVFVVALFLVLALFFQHLKASRAPQAMAAAEAPLSERSEFGRRAAIAEARRAPMRLHRIGSRLVPAVLVTFAKTKVTRAPARKLLLLPLQAQLQSPWPLQQLPQSHHHSRRENPNQANASALALQHLKASRAPQAMVAAEAPLSERSEFGRRAAIAEERRAPMRLHRIGSRPVPTVLVTFAKTKVTRAPARKLLPLLLPLQLPLTSPLRHPQPSTTPYGAATTQASP